MNSRLRIGLIALSIALSVGLSLLLLLVSPVRSAILEPLLIAINDVRFAFGYLPQDIQWGLTLLTGSALVLIFYFSRTRQPKKPSASIGKTRMPSQGPILRFAHVIERSSRSRFNREVVVLELREIAACVLAYHRGISIDDAKDLLEHEAWTDDEAVRALLSLDEHRRKQDHHSDFHSQVQRALDTIEETYQGV